MNSKRLARTGIAAAAIIATLWLLTPPPLIYDGSSPVLPADIDTWLAQREAAVDAEYGLVPGTEKRIHWQVPGERTEFSIVYLHGFSASRQEIAPVPQMIADRLGANLFETRLSGHGHESLPMHEVAAEHWMDDAAEAIEIGGAIGNEVIVIGTSTGATLAMALHGSPVMRRVISIVMLSPNMAPADPKSAWITRPAGPLLGRLMVGDTRSWEPHNALQGKYWTTSYPFETVVEVMRLVDRAEARTHMPVHKSLLMVLSNDDTVISTEAARVSYSRIDAPIKRLLEFPNAGDPSRHVLAGDVLSPSTNEELASLVVDWLQTAGARR